MPQTQDGLRSSSTYGPPRTGLGQRPGVGGGIGTTVPTPHQPSMLSHLVGGMKQRRPNSDTRTGADNGGHPPCRFRALIRVRLTYPGKNLSPPTPAIKYPLVEVFLRRSSQAATTSPTPKSSTSSYAVTQLRQQSTVIDTFARARLWW